MQLLLDTPQRGVEDLGPRQPSRVKENRFLCRSHGGRRAPGIACVAFADLRQHHLPRPQKDRAFPSPEIADRPVPALASAVHRIANSLKEAVSVFSLPPARPGTWHPSPPGSAPLTRQ